MNNINQLDDKYKLGNYVRRLPFMLNRTYGKYVKNQDWSYSSLGTYRSGCKRLFKFSFVDRLPAAVDDPFMFIKGKFLHYLLEKMINRQFLSIDTKPYVPSKASVKVTPELILQWSEIFNRLGRTDKFNDLLKMLNNADYVKCEYKISRNGFIGFIDLCFVYKGLLVLIDWKSGASKVGHFNQLSTYGYGIIEDLLTLGIEINEIQMEYYYVEDSGNNEIKKMPVEQFLEEFYERLVVIKSAIDNVEVEEDWLPNRDKCGFCKYKGPCEEIDGSTDDLLDGLL